MSVITRFAPSPTGYIHIGNIRTALFSWLYARKNKGKFLLRIEDTDLSRFKHIYVENIFFILKHLGLNWDEDVFFQSHRLNLYIKIINFMLNNNMAYKCYCTYERLNHVRNLNIKRKNNYFYDKFCRNKNFNYINKSYVIRFKNPSKGYVSFCDIVYKEIKVLNTELDDFIILRSNGLPTYNFCSVVDDNNMGVTHIIRGDDHLSNTIKQINIFNCLNYKIPVYVHLPMILNSDKKKLSKRDNLFHVKNYLDQGIVPEAILNYVVRLGWSSGNREIFSLNDMKYLFNLFKINKSPCIINYNKLIWINKYYVSNLKYEKLFNYLKYFFKIKNVDINNISNISEIISFFSQRLSNLKDIVENCMLFDNDRVLYEDSFLLKYKLFNYVNVLHYFIKKFSKIIYWDLLNINKVIYSSLIKFTYLETKNIYMILRLFLFGKKVFFNLNIIIFLLKKDNVLFRLKLIKKKLNNYKYY